MQEVLFILGIIFLITISLTCISIDIERKRVEQEQEDLKISRYIKRKSRETAEKEK